jgi:hypothetical protein
MYADADADDDEGRMNERAEGLLASWSLGRGKYYGEELIILIWLLSGRI